MKNEQILQYCPIKIENNKVIPIARIVIVETSSYNKIKSYKPDLINMLKFIVSRNEN